MVDLIVRIDKEPQPIILCISNCMVCCLLYIDGESGFYIERYQNIYPFVTMIFLLHRF